MAVTRPLQDSTAGWCALSP